ncbi:MAG: hypothetical protein WAN51_05755, partial [Alphaproteobacteria bacterium]
GTIDAPIILPCAGKLFVRAAYNRRASSMPNLISQPNGRWIRFASWRIVLRRKGKSSGRHKTVSKKLFQEGMR